MTSAADAKGDEQGMTRVTVSFTIEEIRLLASLAGDQLFRRQFIDPKMPGYHSDPAEVDIGKALVARLRLLIDRVGRDAKLAPPPAPGYLPGSPSKRNNRIPDAL